MIYKTRFFLIGKHLYKLNLQAFLNPSNRAKIKKANTGICIGFKFLKYVR